MIDTSSVKIEFTNDINSEILKCLKVLFSTPAGSLVLDRNFGIDLSILDRPMPQVKALLTAEYIQKVKKYEPRATVKSVAFEYDPLNGTERPKVIINAIN